MTKDEIISMARKAGIAYTNRVHPQVTEYATSEESISRFVALVEAAHTAKLLAGVEMPEPVGYQWMRTGHYLKNLPADAEKYCLEPLHTADQLRETVAAAVAKKDAEIAALKAQVEAPKAGSVEMLDALRGLVSIYSEDSTEPEVVAARTAITRAEQAERVEPVATLHIEKGKVSMAAVILEDGIYPLYTTPPAAAMSEPIAWMSASGWVTASRPVMENSAEKGTVFTPLYK